MNNTNFRQIPVFHKQYQNSGSECFTLFLVYVCSRTVSAAEAAKFLVMNNLYCHESVNVQRKLLKMFPVYRKITSCVSLVMTYCFVDQYVHDESYSNYLAFFIANLGLIVSDLNFDHMHFIEVNNGN